jgi:hypothetical protein
MVMATTATLAEITAESPRSGSGDPIRPILTSGAHLSPAEREQRRLELRRELAGRLIVLTPELRDPRSLDNFLALSPQFPWDHWRAAHPTWHHPEFRRHNYGMCLRDGTLIKAYSVDSLIRMKWVVETIQPLMKLCDIEVPAFYEDLAWRWSGCYRRPENLGGVHIEQTVQLSIQGEPRDTFLLYTAIHELAHGRSLHERNRPIDLYLNHRQPFRRHFGLLLIAFLSTTGRSLGSGQQRWFRSYCVEDRYSPPIHPGPEWGWQFDWDGHYIVCPHPIDNPPPWWSREDR